MNLYGTLQRCKEKISDQYLSLFLRHNYVIVMESVFFVSKDVSIGSNLFP